MAIADVKMNFRIADTFTDSLARLSGDEQKAVKTTAFDLQLNPANPGAGMSFHKLDKAKDKNFWSVRASSDIRIIVHRTDSGLLLCYADHHDRAYAWAERRKLETHPKTGAAQLVEIRETVKEIVVPVYVQTEVAAAAKPAAEKKPIFAEASDDELLHYGVPAEWLNDVKQATEETLLALTEHLPTEAAEALLELATGGKPRVPQPAVVAANPFDHPDAQRRFRVMTNVKELQRALDFPWEKWAVFLHPEQRQWVERDYAGPARVSGSAGTGKTIVALHRAAHLARTHTDTRVLLTTFSDTLANSLHTKLKQLLSSEPRLAERIDVHSLNAIGLRLYKAHVGQATIAGGDELREVMKEAASSVAGHKFSLHFLLTEWEQVVDAWQLENWEAYRDVVRLGRKTRLPEAHRMVLWSIFERACAGLKTRKLITHPELFSALARAISKNKNVVFDFAVVDEAQDIGVAHLRFFAALGGDRPNALFFAGDLGQRIFQQPFSWKALGVDVRGRSRTLRVNYRTSHQIRTQADRLLGPAVTDVDGNSEDRSDTVSVFNGPPPTIRSFKSETEEIKAVGNWHTERAKAGVLPHEFGVFVRSAAQLDRARAAAKEAGMAFKVLDEHVETTSSHISISTMHMAKGLEFRAVVVMACDDEIIPLQERIETVGDDADLREVYDTERHLLYVACTRARDHLLVTSVEPASEFIDDMQV
ncbi:MAG: 3'-5' exonuclease [Phycisphaeraceae bacterium]